MGLTFKENCPDTRNSKVLNLFNHFKNKNFMFRVMIPFQQIGLTNLKKSIKLQTI